MGDNSRAHGQPAGTRSRRVGLWLWRHTYTLMIVPAAVTLLLIILFPLVYTLWMAVHEYSMGGNTPPRFVAFANYLQAFQSQRFLEAIPRTFYFTVLGVVAPTAIGTAAALAFAREFPGRGMLRTIFSLPMMATPVSVALIWQMMFHPQLGVLNYLLSLLHIAPQPWIFSARSVVPTLAIVETWQWAPFVMLIVLGGLAALPTEPYEAALIDGASRLQTIWYVTIPLVWPYIMVAILLRSIDALKAFDLIYVMTQGGPGTASETLNIFLYLQAFAFYNIGLSSAVVVIYFLILLVMSIGLLVARQKTSWQ